MPSIIQRIGLLLLLPSFAWAQPVVTITATDSDAGELNLNPAVFEISRSGGDMTSALRVQLLSEGTAARFTDWNENPALINLGFGRVGIDIPANQNSTELTITPVADNLAEGDETIAFRIDPDSAYTVGVPDQAAVTLQDDAAQVTIVATDADASELNMNPAVFEISRTGGDMTNPLRVQLLAEGTSARGTDWDENPTLLNLGFGRLGIDILADQNSVELTITPVADNLAEGDETIVFRIDPDGAYSIGPADLASVMLQDDAAEVAIVATDTDASELNMNPAVFEISRSGGDLFSALRVRLLPEGSSTRGTDWDENPALFNLGFGRLGIDIPADQSSVELTITPVTDQNEAEGNETLTFRIDPDSAYSIGSADQATITIQNLIDLILSDGFEGLGNLLAKALNQSCNIGVLAKTNPARFHDEGPTIIDLDTGVMWLRCATDQYFDWLDGACATDRFAATVEQSNTALLEQFNANRLGDNGGFDDWRLAKPAAPITTTGNVNDCLAR